MNSLWTQTCTITPRPSLRENLHADAAVIGAGMAGILIAHKLQEAGLRVIVLEADRIGSGQTSGTTAKITSQHGLLYHRLIQSLGEEKARIYAVSQQYALREYKMLIQSRSIPCDFQELPSYVYSDDSELLALETQAALRLGLPASFVRHIELPVKNQGAVCFSGQAQFHPLKFLRSLADTLTIYENTPVHRVENHQIHTKNGTVTADKIIFACHYPFHNFPGFYFVRMHQERSYVLALKNASLPKGMYLGTGAAAYSFRSYGSLLLLGGSGHRTGENPSGTCYELLRQKSREFFPHCQEVAHWSAQDCITGDQLPFIGTYSHFRPDWYVASGFKKWGMTSAMTAALLLCSQICSKTSAFSDPMLPNWLPAAQKLYAPARFSVAELSSTANETGHAIKSLTKTFFFRSPCTAEDLPIGQGGIISFHGQKMGAYRDEDNNFHLVNIRCPHLGCQLEWNPDEKSWDCPCHGSRFDCDGNLLSNPAQTSLPGKKPCQS